MDDFRRIATGSMTFIEWLCAVTATKDAQTLAEAAVKAYEPEGKALPLIEHLIQKEIRTTVQAGTLFRSNSLASKVITAWSKLGEGQDFLVSTLQPVVTSIITGSHGTLEINPTNLAPTDSLETNISLLQGLIQSVLDTIFASADKFPTRFRTVCSYLKQYCNEKFPDQSLICVGGFIILRYFCPAIVAPENNGLVEESPSLEIRRNLVLVSKTVQNLANNVTFRETFMLPLNTFLEANQPKMRVFLESISQPPSTPAVPTQVLPEERESALISLVQLSNTYLRTLDLNYPIADPSAKKLACDEIRAAIPKALAYAQSVTERDRKKMEKQAQKVVALAESEKPEKKTKKNFWTTATERAASKKRDRQLYRATMVQKMCDAAAAGLHEELDILLAANKKLVNWSWAHEMTALHHACGGGKVACVKVLLSHGADCYMPDDKGWSPLHIACSDNHEDIVELLLSQEHIDLNGVNEDENTPLHYLVRHPTLARFIPIFKTRQVNINARNSLGETPLHMAVLKGHPEVISQLLNSGADPNIKNKNPRGEESPYDWAVRMGNKEIIGLLQNSLEATLNAKPLDSAQMTKRFFDAVTEGNAEAVKEFLKLDSELAASISSTTSATPLHVAISNGHVQVVKVLLRAPSTKLLKNSSGFTPLMLALTAGKEDCTFAILLSHHSVDMQHRLADGTTVLHLAVRQSLPRIAMILFALVEHGADINANDNNGDTPLHIAVKENNQPAIDCLLDLGAKVKTNNNRETPITMAKALGRDINFSSPLTVKTVREYMAPPPHLPETIYESDEVEKRRALSNEQIKGVLDALSLTTDSSNISTWIRTLQVREVVEKAGIFPDSGGSAMVRQRGTGKLLAELQRLPSSTLFSSLPDSQRTLMQQVRTECFERINLELGRLRDRTVKISPGEGRIFTQSITSMHQILVSQP
ncbi:Neurofibromin 1 [Pelomyxa schiedti]|nr:Neurofibromin 1 [Pelomyxa schiedti]